MWRNIMSMQNEEIISLKRDIGDCKKELVILNRKYQTVLRRINANSKDQVRIMEITKKSV